MIVVILATLLGIIFPILLNLYFTKQYKDQYTIIKDDFISTKSQAINEIEILKEYNKKNKDVDFTPRTKKVQEYSEEEYKDDLTYMEFKILNTLWTKQVNKFPGFNPLFSFKISPYIPEFVEFRKAGTNLLWQLPRICAVEFQKM